MKRVLKKHFLKELKHYKSCSVVVCLWSDCRRWIHPLGSEFKRCGFSCSHRPPCGDTGQPPCQLRDPLRRRSFRTLRRHRCPPTPKTKISTADSLVDRSLPHRRVFLVRRSLEYICALKSLDRWSATCTILGPVPSWSEVNKVTLVTSLWKPLRIVSIWMSSRVPTEAWYRWL